MLDKEWRPKNPYKRQVHGKPFVMSDEKAFEAGVTAGHEASVEHLDEPCNNPEHRITSKGKTFNCKHKKDCYFCYAAWKGEGEKRIVVVRYAINDLVVIFKDAKIVQALVVWNMEERQRYIMGKVI